MQQKNTSKFKRNNKNTAIILAGILVYQLCISFKDHKLISYFDEMLKNYGYIILPIFIGVVVSIRKNSISRKCPTCQSTVTSEASRCPSCNEHHESKGLNVADPLANSKIEPQFIVGLGKLKKTLVWVVVTIAISWIFFMSESNRNIRHQSYVGRFAIVLIAVALLSSKKNTPKQ